MICLYYCYTAAICLYIYKVLGNANLPSEKTLLDIYLGTHAMSVVAARASVTLDPDRGECSLSNRGQGQRGRNERLDKGVPWK